MFSLEVIQPFVARDEPEVAKNEGEKSDICFK